MFNRAQLLFFIFLVTIFSGSVLAKEPTNLSLLKNEIRKYHDSGAYSADIAMVVTQAENYLSERLQQAKNKTPAKKLAIVLDIDETSLSNYRAMSKYDFHFSKKILREMQVNADDLPILSTRHLYQLAKKNGVAVFFITGRNPDMEHATVDNLTKVGYQHWDGIYFKPLTYQLGSVVPYKTAMRKQIADKGYEVIINIGDQTSDLTGGYSERNYKLPNPFYYIP